MKLSKCFSMALRSILSNKARSMLTMLGIIIGISAVIILISVMDGMTGEVTDAFSDVGTNSISVTLTGRGGNRNLTEEDFYRFVRSYPDYFGGVSPTVTVMGKVKIGSEELESTSVTGVSEDYANIGTREIGKGRYLQYADIAAHKNTCVVGSYIDLEFFGGHSLGQTLKVNGVAFKIVGVLAEKGDSTEGSSNNDCIFIPYTTAAKMSFSEVNSYSLRILREEDYEFCENLLKTWLNQTYENDDYYTVISLKEIADMVSDLLGTMKTVLVCIAAISLLVGGIGIMNIMLVTVTERTREIGIRKSLGAKRRDIMTQFVIESATVSLIGGVFGILLGCSAAVLAGKLLKMTVFPSARAIILATGVSMAIGIVFGYLPASKAAKLNPIDALRYE